MIFHIIYTANIIFKKYYIEWFIFKNCKSRLVPFYYNVSKLFFLNVDLDWFLVIILLVNYMQKL